MLPEAPFEQTEEFVIDNLETLKVAADPLRLQLVEFMADHPHTVKQIAQKLDMPPSKLYYHVNLLEKHGLIAVSSTRMVSGILEKSYLAAARRYHVPRELLSPGQYAEGDGASAALLVAALFDDAKQDIQQGVSNGLIDLSRSQHPLALRLTRAVSRLSDDKALEFHRRLDALLQEFNAEKPNFPEDQPYTLLMALYPTSRGARPNDIPDDLLVEETLDA
ncbi:MAG: helix-turn-helix domain-containing protein [Phototrophicaceae bacterium]|jgi:DNA-binding transcriptional ArsR family regulator